MTEAAPVVTAPELSGKPAAAAVETVDVTIGDKTVKVDKATAEALTDFQKQVKAAGDATTAEVAKLADQLKKLTTQPSAGAVDLENLIFTDPKKAVQLIKDEIRAELNSTLSTTKAQTDFWAEFYRQNDDLKDADWLVKSILAREMEGMAKMKVPEAIKYLSETVKADILKLSGKKPTKGPKVELEGGNERRPAASKDTEAVDEPVGSISDELKARKARRRAGAGKAA